MMKLAKPCALLALTLAAGACGERGGEDGTRGADSAAAAMAADSAPTPGAAEAGTTEVPFAAVGGSGVSGGATLSEQGEQVQVTVRLAGLPPNSSHSGHVHEGTCAAPGSPVAPLLDVAADASGSGTSTSLVPLPMSTVMDGRHVVAYHQAAGDDPGPPVVCGAVPAQRM